MTHHVLRYTGTPVPRLRGISVAAGIGLFVSFSWLYATASPNAFGASCRIRAANDRTPAATAVTRIMLSLCDLLTQVERRLRCFRSIFNNDSFDFVKNRNTGSRHHPFGVDFKSPTLRQVAEAMGAKESASNLARARNCLAPRLLHTRTPIVVDACGSFLPSAICIGTCRIPRERFTFSASSSAHAGWTQSPDHRTPISGSCRVLRSQSLMNKSRKTEKQIETTGKEGTRVNAIANQKAKANLKDCMPL